MLHGGMSCGSFAVDLGDRVGEQSGHRSLLRYQVAVHFAPHYHALRHWICGDDLNFVRSLQRCPLARPGCRV